MNINFEISQITFEHEQAIDFSKAIIDAIENYGIQNFEKENEILMHKEDNCLFDEFFDVYIKAQIITEYKDQPVLINEPPEPEIILNRFVKKISIQIFNKEGNKVAINIMGKKEKLDFFTALKFHIHTPVSIEELIESYFKV